MLKFKELYYVNDSDDNGLISWRNCDNYTNNKHLTKSLKNYDAFFLRHYIFFTDREDQESRYKYAINPWVILVTNEELC